MDEKRQRLDRVVERRDRLQKEVQRVTGRLEGARQELGSLERECRDKGIDPDSLDDAIERLSARYDKAVGDLETRVEKSEQALRPFVGEDS
jgi:predicted nuclease with TOPRIM domain